MLSPQPIDNPDLTKVVEAARICIYDLQNNCRDDLNSLHHIYHIYETVLVAIYGEEIIQWIKEISEANE